MPVLVGARGPKTLALAGELADGLVLDASLTAAGVAPGGGPVARGPVVCGAARRAAARGGRGATCSCGSAPGSAERILAQLANPTDPLPERTALGTPAEVAADIRAYADAGATTVALQPTPDDPDIEGTLRLAAAARAHLHREG